MSLQDTICAVSTPAGEGGIGIVRMSGNDAVTAAEAVFRPKRRTRLSRAGSNTMHYGHIVEPSTGEVIDEVIVSVMRAPLSYTREDVIEINCHGGMMPLWRTMRLLIARGARQAEPGEFTKRAFLNGRIDLAQAEAVMDIIRAQTEASHRAANEQLIGGLSRAVHDIRERIVSITAGIEAAVDFSEEDIEASSGGILVEELQDIIRAVDELLAGAFSGKVLREGYATAIVGRPNVGKSSLLNALLMQDRAIVTEVPGTTRDILEERLNISGILLRVLDTAGIRHTSDIVEQEGVKRSLAAIEAADIVLIVLDGSEKMKDEDRRVLQAAAEKRAVAVINKSDLGRGLERIDWPKSQVEVSCRNGKGLSTLRAAIFELMQGGVMPATQAWAVNQRHATALEQTKRSLERAMESSQSALSPEFIAIDLRDALDHIGTIVGKTCTEDILQRIFIDFCIGK
jgi:tRNA modification GTPase